MALITPVAFAGLTGNSYPAARLRRVHQLLLGGREGVLGAGDMLVTPTTAPSLSVRVAAGAAVVNGDDATRQGAYVVENDAQLNVGPVTTPHGSLARIDRLVLEVLDKEGTGSGGGGRGSDTPQCRIVAGTPSASPAAPAEPATAITLALITVPAGATAIVSGDITDARVVFRVAPQWVTADLADDAVTTAKIIDGAVTTGKIIDGAVTTGKIIDGAVTTGKIAAGAVTETKLASNAITTGKIADGAVTIGKLAAKSSWTTSGFAAGWSAEGGTPGADRAADGLVVLRGGAKRAGTYYTDIFTLPAGYWPAATVNACVVDQNSTSRVLTVSVSAAGVVRLTGATGGLSDPAPHFSGIAFYAA